MAEIRLLGAPEARQGSTRLPLGTPKQQVAFALLALQSGRLVTTDMLVDELWPDDPPRSALANVRSYAGNLRRAFERLGGPKLVRLPGGYRLDLSDEQVDVHRFERLTDAARSARSVGEVARADLLLRQGERLWRGSLIAGLPVGPVLWARRAALEEQRLSAIELRAGLDIELGRTRAAIALLTDHAERHPYREQAQALLAGALSADGDPAGALAVLDRAEAVLSEQLGVEPGSELRDLRTSLLGRVPPARSREDHGHRLGSGRPADPTGRSRAKHDHLPRSVVEFVGRRELVERTVTEIESAGDRSSTVRVIDGMAGSGKTAFALHLARLLAHRYPDGQLFIDLRGHNEKAPVDPADALTMLLRQMEVPAGRIPSDRDERVELWQRELRGRRVVLVLDNAAGGHQVRPLLPSAGGSVVLVTSRRRLSAGDVGPPVSLPVLTSDEAVRLLARTAGEARVSSEPDAAAAVARRCGHLPLAVRLAGGWLAHRPTWRVADLARRLDAGSTVLRQLAVEQQTVADAFSASYEQLAEPVRRLFRLVSLHPGDPFDARMAAALAELRLDHTERMLDDLLDQHLIEEPAPGRYRLHDLMRQYSAELFREAAEPAERHEAVARLLDHVLHQVAARANTLDQQVLRAHLRLDPPARADLIDASDASDVEWLERERPNLVSLIRLAEREGHLGHAWRLARAMWRFCYMRGYFDDIVATHRVGLSAAERSGDRSAQAIMHNYLASAYTRTGSYLDSLRHLETAVSISRDLHDRGNEHRYRANLVVVHWLTGDPERSVTLGRQLLREDPRGGVEPLPSLPNLGYALTAVGRYAEALEAHRQHLFLARCQGSQYHMSNALGHIASVENRLGHHAKAVRLLTASIRLRDRTGHRFGEAEARNDLGIAYRHLGRFDDARVQHEMALDQAKDSGERHVQAAALNDLGLTLAAAGRVAAAVTAHGQALALATRIAHPYEQGRALCGLAEHLEDDRPAEARRYRQRALAIFDRMGVPERHELRRRLAEPPSTVA
ncbi:DNA-binding transcriptional activator of the SARP family [Micromonospora sediminicola]|uniref:DNA-binding transcriptional activator of the SARP family n=1 Tax=Micromonospora sediminicola TaxID=946078 RepID=A0A1A9B3S0_9ACTN|nr:BTAD domain-containing putative transcriptional regulator [Micromonospora sediminicola]SBT63562.1 DNA-binding transcriptional activator of the SARP family [Micromonospora sediminicola]